MLAVPITLALVFSATTLGHFLIGVKCSFHERFIIGLNVLALVTLCLWRIQPKYPSLILLFFTAIALLAGIYRLRTKSIRSLISSRRLDRSSLRKAFGEPTCILSLALLWTLGPALTFPAGWDELTYHIALPWRWWREAGLTVQQDLPYSALPSLSEIIFSLGLPVESLIFPRLITWLVWYSGTMLLLSGCAAISTNRWNIWLVCLCLAISPISLMISANVYVEAFVWADCAAITSLLLRSPSQIGNRLALVLGLLVGGAVATKVTSVGLLILPLLFGLSRTKQIKLPALGIYVLSCVCFATPFFLRSWIASGNPLAPYYAEWFTDQPCLISVSQYHHQLASGNFGIPGWIGTLAAPFALAMANEIYDGSFGWQWLIIFCLACMVLRERRSAVVSFKNNSSKPKNQDGTAFDASTKTCINTKAVARILLVQSAILGSIWIASSQQARFAVPVVQLVGLVALLGLDQLSASGQRWLRSLLLGATVFSLPWSNFGYYADSWLHVLRLRSTTDYLLDGVGDSYAELSSFLHEHVRQDEKVISLFEHRVTFLPPQTQIATPFFQASFFCQSLTQPDSQTIFRELQDRRVKYIVLTPKPLGPDVSASHIEQQQTWFHQFDQLIVSGKLKIIWKSEEHAVAELQPAR